MNLQANASSVSAIQAQRPVGACMYSQPRQLPAKDNLGTFLPDLCDALEEALQRSVRLEQRQETTQTQTLHTRAPDRDRTTPSNVHLHRGVGLGSLVECCRKFIGSGIAFPLEGRQFACSQTAAQAQSHHTSNVAIDGWCSPLDSRQPRPYRWR